MIRKLKSIYIIVNAINKYQTDKNELTKEYLGEELIPENRRLSRLQILFNLKLIVKYFKFSSDLESENCIHCNIYNHDIISDKDACIGCVYGNKVDRCFSQTSTYYKVLKAYNELGSLDRPKARVFELRLDDLGTDLRLLLDNYELERK